MKTSFSVDDLTKGALKRLVAELLAAKDGEEQAILNKLAKRGDEDKERNDLADLVEEKRGKPAAISSDEDESQKKTEIA
jgi:hypothetical protein